jgi:hypothetical protein
MRTRLEHWNERYYRDRHYLEKKVRRRFPMLPPAWLDARHLRRMRLRHVVTVDQPMVLVSQANRSGGSLLAQLFSGHPDCHVHPGEIHFGHPRKVDWPDLDPSLGPKVWFRQLSEYRTPQYARFGFSKIGRDRSKYDDTEIVFPFLFLRRLQRQIFCQVLAPLSSPSNRQIIDAYFTSYFNAWLDYQELYAPKRYVVGFTPRMSSEPKSVEHFFRDYPEGRLISVIREPKSWFVSLRGRKPHVRVDPRPWMERWRRSADAALRNRELYAPRVHVLRFEHLVGDTEGAMRGIADFLGLPFHEVLTRPTFQGRDILANTSFVQKQAGIIDAPLERARTLSAEDTACIEEMTSELSDRVSKELEPAARPPSP